MEKIKITGLTLMLILSIVLLSACAPGAHVRVGVGANVPNAWAGPYPYPPADRPVTVGKPYTDDEQQNISQPNDN